MCIFFTISSARRSEGSSVLLLDEEEFKRLWKSPYREVLEKHEPPSNVSKSYFYYAYEKLKGLKILKGKSLNFKLILPMKRSQKKIELDDGLILNDFGKIIYWVEGDLYKDCDKCPVREECVGALKDVARAFGLKITTSNPHEGWVSVISKVRETALKDSKAIELVSP